MRSKYNLQSASLTFDDAIGNSTGSLLSNATHGLAEHVSHLLREWPSSQKETHFFTTIHQALAAAAHKPWLPAGGCLVLFLVIVLLIRWVLPVWLLGRSEMFYRGKDRQSSPGPKWWINPTGVKKVRSNRAGSKTLAPVPEHATAPWASTANAGTGNHHSCGEGDNDEAATVEVSVEKEVARPSAETTSRASAPPALPPCDGDQGRLGASQVPLVPAVAA